MNQSLFWFFASIMLSCVFTGLMFAVMNIKGKARNWMLLLLGLLPVVFSYMWNPLSRTVMNHGFYHISIAYQIINGAIPPNDPLFAGEPLIYPWGYDLVAAKITSGLHIPLDSAYVLINLLCLLLSMILVFRTAAFGFNNLSVGIFAVFLSIFGVSIFIRGPIASILKNISGFLASESRVALPNKFFNVAPTCLGIFFFALFLYSIVGILSQVNKNTKLYYIPLIASIVGCGFLYPQFWPALVASSLTSSAIIYFRHRQVILPKIIGVMVCVVLTSVLVVPYLIQIGSGNSGEATNLFNPNIRFMLVKSFRYFWGLIPISAILVWKRKTFLELLRTKTDFTMILLTITATTALMYIWFNFSSTNEYKYYILSWFTIALLSSVCLWEIYVRHRIVSFILISSFLLLLSSELLYYSFGDSFGRWQISDRYVANGMVLSHNEQNENTLYQWINRQTKPDAMLIDSYLTIPVFAQRPLFVGLDARRSNFAKNTKDGWNITAEEFLKVHGHPLNMVNERKRIANLIYSDSPNEISKDVFLEMNTISKGRDLYIVARDVNTINKLEKSLYLNKVFQNSATAVYQLKAVS